MGNKERKGRKEQKELEGRVEEHWVGGIEIEKGQKKEFNSSFKMTDEISQRTAVKLSKSLRMLLGKRGTLTHSCEKPGEVSLQQK